MSSWLKAIFSNAKAEGEAKVLYDDNGARYAPITSEYALYFDTTNEYSPAEGELGVDYLALVSRFCNILMYPIAGYMIDRFGLKVLTYGAFGQSIGNWIFFLAKRDYQTVIFGRVIIGVHGPLIYGSILRITSHWFPATERVFAIAAAIFLSSIGGSFALLIPPLYKEGDEELNLDLKSCSESYIDDLIEEGYDFNNTACTNEADDNFCCAAPTDIEGVNFLIAVLTTVGFVYALLVVRDAPPSPPTISGKVNSTMGFFKSFKHVFSHWNYVWMNIADFLASGVALVVYNTISRIFPSSVADLAFYITSAALPIAVPMSFFFSWYLGKTGKYYDLAAACYWVGFFCWWLATAGLAIGGVGDYLVVVGATLASLLYLMWQVAVFEVKLEYVFDPAYALQGTVVAVDRCLINMASLTFLAAIPPERYEGPAFSGRMFTFLVGGAVFFVAVMIIAFMPGKRKYLRAEYEKAHENEEERDEVAVEKKDLEIAAVDDKEILVEVEAKAAVEESSEEAKVEEGDKVGPESKPSV
eukprot:maker-scaffold_7-snap-gene-7.35-mRNA-1 protein AED:0.08 eAED:0.12 QI:0/0/0.5/1/0/0.5/2/68/527